MKLELEQRQLHLTRAELQLNGCCCCCGSSVTTHVLVFFVKSGPAGVGSGQWPVGSGRGLELSRLINGLPCLLMPSCMGMRGTSAVRLDLGCSGDQADF